MYFWLFRLFFLRLRAFSITTLTPEEKCQKQCNIKDNELVLISLEQLDWAEEWWKQYSLTSIPCHLTHQSINLRPCAVYILYNYYYYYISTWSKCWEWLWATSTPNFTSTSGKVTELSQFFIFLFFLLRQKSPIKSGWFQRLINCRCTSNEHVPSFTQICGYWDNFTTDQYRHGRQIIHLSLQWAMKSKVNTSANKLTETESYAP